MARFALALAAALSCSTSVWAQAAPAARANPADPYAGYSHSDPTGDKLELRKSVD